MFMDNEQANLVLFLLSAPKFISIEHKNSKIKSTQECWKFKVRKIMSYLQKACLISTRITDASPNMGATRCLREKSFSVSMLNSSQLKQFDKRSSLVGNKVIRLYVLLIDGFVVHAVYDDLECILTFRERDFISE